MKLFLNKTFFTKESDRLCPRGLILNLLLAGLDGGKETTSSEYGFALS